MRASQLGKSIAWRRKSAMQHVDNSVCVRVYQHEHDPGGAVFEFFRQARKNF